MKVLVTGAFGNIGHSTVSALIQQGHEVTCFDIRTRANARAARRLGKGANVIWGDIRSRADVENAVAGQDAVIHLAFVIPSLSATGHGTEERPDWARAINVGGTQNLVESLEVQARPARLIFASSLHIYGPTQHLSPPRTVQDPPNPTEHYSRHKVECERLIRASSLEWSIFRFAAVLPLNVRLDRAMYDVPLNNRMEFVHTRDVGFALARAVTTRQVWGKTLLIGGGPECQLVYREIARGVLDAAGVGMLPDEAFASKQFCTDWLDTSESQRILGYQQHTFSDYLRELRLRLGLRARLARLFRPLVRAYLLRRSPYASLARQSEGWRGRVALVTGASSGVGAATASALAARGLCVALVARREERLEALADEIRDRGGKALVLPADVSQESECRRITDETRAAFGPIDVLVNCAGLGWHGPSDEMPRDVAEKMLLTNVAATSRMTFHVLPEMKSRGTGHIINIGSLVGQLPAQGVALYGASKAFAHALSTALYRELAGHGVYASILNAGWVDTEFFRTAEGQPSALPIPGQRLAVSAEQVAERIWGLLRRPRRVAYVPRLVSIAPWIELLFGWLLDLIGPALMRRQKGYGEASAT